ncbi:GGDEF domain-containing protein, partial [Desulfovibrio sp. 1214_IL3152]
VTASQGDRARLEDLVRNDALTGLRSRTYYGMTVDKLERQQMRPVSIIIADMDGLKLVNDHMGHSEGSEMLCRAAVILRSSLNSADCIARMGGDEFAAIVPGCAREDLDELMQRIRDAFDAHNINEDHVPTHMSVGGACAQDMTTTLAQALSEADRNMLAVKRENSPRWRLRIKNWIEKHTGKAVQLDDSRYRMSPVHNDS